MEIKEANFSSFPRGITLIILHSYVRGGRGRVEGRSETKGTGQMLRFLGTLTREDCQIQVQAIKIGICLDAVSHSVVLAHAEHVVSEENL